MNAIRIPENLKHIVPYVPKVCIPMIIHQTYKSLEKLPEIWKDTPSTWKEYHPEWVYMFWSDDDCRRLVKERFPWFLKTYDGYEHNIQRADAIRPMMLYCYGGLYADCDIQPIKSFDDLFYKDSDVYLIRTPNNNVVTNCLMASKAGIKFWLYVIEEMKNRADDPNPFLLGKHWEVMYSTGPMMLNTVFNDHENNIKVHFLPREFILPSDCSTCVPKPCSTRLGYTRLLEGSSWIGYDTMVYNFIMCSYNKLLVLFAVAFVLYNVCCYLKVPVG